MIDNKNLTELECYIILEFGIDILRHVWHKAILYNCVGVCVVQLYDVVL